MNNKTIKKNLCWVWWYMPIIPALRRLRQEDYEFKATWATQ
jgi:hypothetical protein